MTRWVYANLFIGRVQAGDRFGVVLACVPAHLSLRSFPNLPPSSPVQRVGGWEIQTGRNTDKNWGTEIGWKDVGGRRSRRGSGSSRANEMIEVVEMAWVRRATLSSFLIGIVLVAITVAVSLAPITWTDANVGFGFLLSLALIAGSGAVVLAANGLIWRLVIPRLAQAQPRRRRIVAALTTILSLVSVPLTVVFCFVALAIPNAVYNAFG